MKQGVRCIVRGLVQGVFFRDSTRRVALNLDIDGHAINLPDGSVEVVASGAPESVRALQDWLQEGPAHARVDAVECESIDEVVPPGFRVG